MAVAASTIPADDVRPLFRAILAFGALALVILTVGFAEFVYFEPPGQRTTTQARIEGVYAYDASAKNVTGSDRDSFNRDEGFAAVVDWASLPPDVVAGARWYDSFGDVVGSVGPAPAAQLQDRSVVAVESPSGGERNLPGHYLFVVERYSKGQPIEVLGRRIVVVRRID